jgi:hypothetical protein
MECPLAPAWSTWDWNGLQLRLIAELQEIRKNAEVKSDVDLRIFASGVSEDYSFGRTMDCCAWYLPFLSA